MKKSDLSNIDIALFALYKLGGISAKIHTEHIAMEAYQLAEERFSWRLPEYRGKFPDKSPVRFALEQAKKKEQGKLVTGRAGGDNYRPELEGWRFTPEGAEWIRENESRIAEALEQETPDLRKSEAKKFLKTIKSDICFKQFQRIGALDEVSPYMFTDMLGCSPDAPKQIIRQKYDRLLTTAKLVKDRELITFLEACASSFSSLLMEN
jgi:hypothetical protein